MKRNSIREKLSGRLTASRRTDAEAVAPSEAGAGRALVPAAGSPEISRLAADDEVLYHLGSLLDSVKTAIISLDGEGRVRVFNAVAETLFCTPRQAVLGKSFSTLGRMSSFAEIGLRALWERLSDAVWAAGAALDLEYDLLRPKGQKRVLLYSVYPLGRLPWSVGNGVVILLDDITRKKEMEELISDGRKRLQTVFDGITDGIQVIDRDFLITAVNRSMTALVGGAVSIGSHCYKSCGSITGVCDDCPGVETFRSGRPSSVIKRIHVPKSIHQDGERILEISTFPLLDRGNRVTQIVEYIKDVTDRVSFAERLEHARRLAAIGEMAARVAHEVRNPLNAITGAAHYLATEYPSDETIQKFTTLILRQSLRVDQVASDILHASRPLRLNRMSVSVDSVVEQAVNALADRLREQGISLDRRCGAVSPVVLADEVQVEQAVFNILKNAVEAMPDGGTLIVETGIEAEGRWVRIAIEDSGHGIPEGDRDKVFAAFYTTKTHGTGLGLSIVEGVLKNHGGSISFEQPDHQGTRVVVRLPAPDNSSSRRSSRQGESMQAQTLHPGIPGTYSRPFRTGT